MATQPQFVTTPNTGIVPNLVTASTSFTDMTNASLLFTAGATGSILQRIRIKPIGTNIATVLRVFINNNGTISAAANNSLWDEYTLPATTANAAAALQTFGLTVSLVLKANYRVYIALGTTVAGGYDITGIGADF